jgi:hypothetical protein
MSDFNTLYDGAVTAMQAPIKAYYARLDEIDKADESDAWKATQRKEALAKCEAALKQALADEVEKAGKLAADQASKKKWSLSDAINAIKDTVKGAINTLGEFLDGFLKDLPDLTYEQAMARAALYATSILQTASEAQIAFTDTELPYTPGCDDLDCSWHCRCHLEVEEKRGIGPGNFDVYWVMDPDAEHCESCLELSKKWNPFKIRNGQWQGDFELSNTKMAHVLHLLVGASMVRL